jgi:hypothetical protein
VELYRIVTVELSFGLDRIDSLLSLIAEIRIAAMRSDALARPLVWRQERVECGEPGENLDAHYLRVQRSAVGPPWDKDHKLAMAAAIVAGSALVE